MSVVLYCAPMTSAPRVHWALEELETRSKLMQHTSERWPAELSRSAMVRVLAG